MSALLKVDGVSQRFRGLLAVNRLSFEVPKAASSPIREPPAQAIGWRRWRFVNGRGLRFLNVA